MPSMEKSITRAGGRVMPSGPLVRGVSSLMKIWMIVPKASVTIAR